MPTNQLSTGRRRSLQMAVTIWTGLLLGGWLLAARSAAGELARPVGPGLAWAATISMAVLGLVATLFHRHAQPGSGRTTTPLVATLTLTPALLTGFVLLDFSNLASRIGLPGIAVTTAAVLLVGNLVHNRRRRGANSVACSTTALAVPPPNLSQTLIRHRDSTGDRLEGDLTMHWQPGQRQQPVHVPFVPAFEETPEVSCTCDDNELAKGVRARVAEVRRFGTRIELRRSGEFDVEQTTRLKLSVILDDSARRAA